MISWYVTKDLSIDTPPFTRNNSPPSFIISRRYTSLPIIHENKILRSIKQTNEQQYAWTGATNHKAVFQWHHRVVIVVVVHNHVQVFHYYVWKENVFGAWEPSFSLTMPLRLQQQRLSISVQLEFWECLGEFFYFAGLCLCKNVSRSYRFTTASSSGTLLSITLILRRSRTGTVWFYTSTSNKRAARPKMYTKSLTRDLKRMYSRLTLVRISINL